MEIRLSPEHEAIVAEDVASGRYANAEEFFAEAVELLHLRIAHDEDSRLLDESVDQGERGELFTNEEIERDLDALRERLEHSWQQSERGELISEEEVHRRMKAMKAEWARRPKIA